MLGVQDLVMGMMKENKQIMDWGRTLASQQAVLLNIARALVSYPEILCIQKPCQRLAEKPGRKVMDALLGFVRDRGLCYDMAMRDKRRVRTCVATLSNTNVYGKN